MYRELRLLFAIKTAYWQSKILDNNHPLSNVPSASHFPTEIIVFVKYLAYAASVELAFSIRFTVLPGFLHTVRRSVALFVRTLDHIALSVFK